MSLSKLELWEAVAFEPPPPPLPLYFSFIPFVCCPKRGGEGVCYQLSLRLSKNDPNNKIVKYKLITSSDQHLSSNDFCLFWLSGCYLRAERFLEAGFRHPETVCTSPSSELLQLSLHQPRPPWKLLQRSSTQLGSSTHPSAFGLLGKLEAAVCCIPSHPVTFLKLLLPCVLSINQILCSVLPQERSLSWPCQFPPTFMLNKMRGLGGE